MINPAKIAGGLGQPIRNTSKIYYVDGDNGSDVASGKSPSRAKKTIQAAVTQAGAYSTVYVFPKTITDYTGDPTSYAETIIIPATHVGLSLIGVNTGRTQGGLPQVKKGSGSTALLTVRAAGCLVANMGFNGSGSTGGGLLLDDDYAAKCAFGTTIYNCHFKNCVGSTATNAATGGAIMWSAQGNAWQVLIKGCRFYKNVGDIVLLGTANTVPQDVVIEDCVFSGPAANTDCNIYTGGSGINGLIIRDCLFTAMPALGGTNDRYVNLTGSVGLMANCYFASIVSPTGSEGTFAAAGTLAKIPATMFIANCYGETTTTAESGQIFRT